MQRIPTFDISHNYNLQVPDSIFDLAAVDGHAHRIIVWRACGARDRLRISESYQRPGEPEFPSGAIRYLYIGKDAVLPMYAVTEYRAAEWNIEVRYDGGGESVVYSFRDKDQALAFQSMVTGYEVTSCFENMAVYITHRRHSSGLMNALRLRPHLELSGVGEVQLWRRRTLTAGPRPDSAPQSASSGPGSNSSTNAERIQHLSDNLSLCTDSTTGQQFYMSDNVSKPLLVMFVKEQSGSYSMNKTELTPLMPGVKENTLILQPEFEASDAGFAIGKLTVPSAGLARWNVCALGALAKMPPLEALTCTSLILEPRGGDARSIEYEILQLRVEYAEAILANRRARGAARRNLAPQMAMAPTAGSGSGSTGSSSPSTTASRFTGLPSLGNFESLAGMINRGTMAAQRDESAHRAAELDSAPSRSARSTSNNLTYR